MMVIKCKMCGGDIDITGSSNYGTCDSCGTVSTLPKTVDDKIVNLYNRANNLRLQKDFDKSLEIYESIIAEDGSQAEAHWCALLCKFGIEYVEEPVSNKRVPVCHRASFDDILEDIDYKEAIELTDDMETKAIYEKEATYISKVQHEIISISQKETPYDIFICYKESDENGERTIDSTLAQDLYYQLTNEGYKVFFARLTLEDKLGEAYEPYIFAALNSAKIMLVLGTKADYFNAIWVKNEWSRYLSILKKDKSKLLIPCYRDMDAYDIPKELSMFQSQDMGKLGFVQDILRGINKVLKKEEKTVVVQNNIVQNTNTSIDNLNPLLKRIKLSIEDNYWAEAQKFCNDALNINPEHGLIYFYLFCIEHKISDFDTINKIKEPIKNNFFDKAIRFADADADFKNRLNGYVTNIKKNIQNIENEKILKIIDDKLKLIEEKEKDKSKYVIEFNEFDEMKKELGNANEKLAEFNETYKDKIANYNKSFNYYDKPFHMIYSILSFIAALIITFFYIKGAFADSSLIIAILKMFFIAPFVLSIATMIIMIPSVIIKAIIKLKYKSVSLNSDELKIYNELILYVEKLEKLENDEYIKTLETNIELSNREINEINSEIENLKSKMNGE